MNDFDYGKSLGAVAYMEHATDQDKTIIRFGMIPTRLMEAIKVSPDDLNGDASRGFASGVFACANSDGGMIA
jgi:hypothetical protein